MAGKRIRPNAGIEEVSVPAIKNNGKVLTSKGNAKGLKDAVKLDMSPIIPHASKPQAKPVPVVKADSSVLAAPAEEQIQQPATVEQLRENLIEMGCRLSEKLIGPGRNFNTNPPNKDCFEGIRVLLDVYAAVKDDAAKGGEKDD